jgi:HlyD family secretion protein
MTKHRLTWLARGLFFLGLGVAPAVGLGCNTGQSGTGSGSSQGSVAAKAPGKVTALGRIEPTGGVVTISIPLADQLAELMVKEGTEVEKDEPLAKLTSHRDRQLELALWVSQVEEAEKKRDQIAKAGNAQIEVEKFKLRQAEFKDQQEVQAQDLKVAKLRRNLADVRKTWERVQSLQGGTLSGHERDQQKLLFDQAKTDFEGAGSLLNDLKKARQLNLEAAAAELESVKATLARTLAEVPVDSLRQQKELAEQRLRHTILRAPTKGVILKILAHPGELVGGSQPLLQMADTSDMSVIAEVYETDIRRVEPGQRAEVHSRTFADGVNVQGRVTQVGRMIHKNRVYDPDPTADVDRRVFEVKIGLGPDSKQSKQVAGMINHQVTVEIFSDEPAAP